VGYVRARKTYRLVFEDEEFAGLEVVARSASVEAYQRIAGLASRPIANPPTADDLEEIDHLYRSFAGLLVSWNLQEGRDGPESEGFAIYDVPATYEGLRSQDLPFATAIILAWMDAVAGVSRPLGRPSTAGSLEGSLPMEVLSP
jgi:hypothetical protein